MFQKAIVIGGSIAGLAAASALSRHFSEVVVLERDTIPPGEKERPGVPQARHLHALLLRGLQIFQEYFPSLNRELDSFDVLTVKVGTDFHFFYPNGWSPLIDTGVYARGCTRPLLESIMRSDLRKQSSVSYMEGVGVKELISNAAGTAVAGVRIHHANSSTDSEIFADLVVDASGRSSRAPVWLEALGYGTTKEVVVDAHWGYATRFLERTGTLPGVKLGAFIMHVAPDMPRLGLVIPVEGGRWQVNLAGVMADYPPDDEEGFLEYARTLRSPLIYNLLRSSKALTPISTYRRTDNRLRKFDLFKRWPERFVVIGDALCAFNPVYGQGMSVAAIEAKELDKSLQNKRSLNGFARNFQRKLSKVVQGPWMLAIGEDLRWPKVDGDRPGIAMRMMLKYVDQIIGLAPSDPYVFTVFQEISHMIKQPYSLFQPRIVWKVISNLLRKRKRALQPVPVRSRESLSSV